MDEVKFTFRDISAETFGKYQHCTMRWDGLWWADSDIFLGKKWGAKPSPRQDTPEKRRLAKLISDTPLRWLWP